MANRKEEEIQKLFGDGQVQSAPYEPPVSTYTGYSVGEAIPLDIPTDLFDNTLDEPLWTTIKRDIIRIGKNMKIVLFPFNVVTERQRALKNWDLWGPLLFILLLMIFLVTGEKGQTKETIATVVFSTLGVGALVLTLNVVLLGGTIVFFQSVCLLGYCLFPLVFSSIFCLFITFWLVRWPIVLAALAWSCYAAVPFIAESVPSKRRALAVYPVVLLYMCVAWMELVK